jgi:hypothetical protein
VSLFTCETLSMSQVWDSKSISRWIRNEKILVDKWGHFLEPPTLSPSNFASGVKYIPKNQLLLTAFRQGPSDWIQVQKQFHGIRSSL